MPVNAPSEVVDPVGAIAAAENEAASLDVLVCGNCQSVFHFVEEFHEHKLKNDCKKADKSSLNLQGSKKPQVWAFLIWKNSQQKAADQQGSWKLYQSWCNMPETQRQSWVTAGRNIQAFINLSHARELNKVDLTTKDTDREVEDDAEEDFVVEKIVGKRFNPKKKQIEYLLKWEGYPPEQNTWEPLSNLTTCKTLLQEYERQAAQQLNNKTVMSKIPGILKKDNISTTVKLASPITAKPSGLLPSKFSVVDKKVDPIVPTLQTQRKIVPVTPLSNSTPISKTSPTTLRTDSHKEFDVSKSTTAEGLNRADSPQISAAGDSKTALKKRVVVNAASDETAKTVTLTNDQKIDKANSKVPETSKEWPGIVNLDDAVNTSPLKRSMGSDDNLQIKRTKLGDDNESVAKIDDSIEIPKSGIFKKSDLREKFPSINNIFGKSNSENTNEINKSSTFSKNIWNTKGILKVDHAQMPELQPGIYKMSLKSGTVKIEMVGPDKNVTALLPAMPGPKGGVLVLGNRLDMSKIARIGYKPPAGSDKPITPRLESPAFRGIFPKSKINEDNSGKVIKPDLQSKNLSISDSAKKPLGSSLRKVLGGPLPKAKGRNSISLPTTARFKTSFVKNYDSMADSSNSRHADSDGFVGGEFYDIENSDLEEYSMPDDFPEELNLEPLSPSGPLTLDPATGKRLMRAEGEPTPEPTPEPSPVPSPAPAQLLQQDGENATDNENLLTNQSTQEGTFNEINGGAFKVTTAGAVGFVQGADFASSEGGLKGIAVTAGDSNDSNLLTITGEDGLVYQVANAKLEGDTIVVASGEDEQQCVFVTEDGHQVMQRTNEDGSTILTLESSYADAVAQLIPNQVNILPDGSQIYVKQEENGQVELVQLQGTEIAENETQEEQETQIAENADENSGQVVAQLIDAGKPAPGGGPRQVVLLLPDGNLMVTEVEEEQFAALELEK